MTEYRIPDIDDESYVKYLALLDRAGIRVVTPQVTIDDNLKWWEVDDDRNI